MKYPLGHDSRGRPHVELLEVPCHEDPRELLAPLNFDALPFAPRRVFVVSGVPAGTVRGRHAHRSQTQALLCPAGSIEVELKAACRASSVLLDRPGLVLVIHPGVWSAQTFIAADTVEMVLASGSFDPSDYLREQ